MNNLGLYYKSIQDYDQMKKYYLMAIEKNNEKAMYNLAIYYKSIKDYDQMNKYYLMAIEKDNKLIDKVKHYLKPLELYLLLDQKEQLKQTIHYKDITAFLIISILVVVVLIHRDFPFSEALPGEL